MPQQPCRTPTGDGVYGEVRQCECGRTWQYSYGSLRSKHLAWHDMTTNKRWMKYMKKKVEN